MRIFAGKKSFFHMKDPDTNPASSHPLKALTSEIERYGVVVFDNVTSLPAYGEPYVSPFLTIGLNERGFIRADYDMQPVEFHPHDISVIYPGHILLGHETSPDYRARLLAVSPPFLEEVGQFHPQLYHFTYHIHGAYHLTDSQYDTITHVFSLVQTISRMPQPEAKGILVSQMKVLTELIDYFYRQNSTDAMAASPGDLQLTGRFYNAVVEHYRESREIQFYANLLCLSPKYFGSVIKTATGVSASEWISRYVVIQAKKLLRNRPDLSIQQVADLLGFPDHTAFARYFKRATNLSPKDYRNSL